MMHYQFSWDACHRHTIRIRLFIAKTVPKQLLSLPVWIPGSYMVRDFAKNVQAVCAYDRDSRAMFPVHKTDKTTWHIECPEEHSIIVEYDVYAYDLSVRTAYVDHQRIFFNPSSVCLYDPDRPHQEHRISLPAHPNNPSWTVATGLHPLDVDEQGFGDYIASSYDELIDHPFELSLFQKVSFDVHHIPHHIFISGQSHPHIDLKALAQDVQKICLAQYDLFQGVWPFKNYTFMLFVGAKGLYGGLEHRNSTALIAHRDALPKQNDIEKSDEYIELLGLFSHEYFHSWNVKSIKPQVFSPYDLHKENPTKLLWAFEGITAYYDNLMLLRSGIIPLERYLKLLNQDFSRTLRSRGWEQQTLEEASYDAWIKYYRPDENSINALSNYYVQGSLAAMLMDFTIRFRSNGEKGLDDVMRFLWHHHHTVQEDEWLTLVKQATGVDVSDCYDVLIRRRGIPHWDKALMHAGLAMDISSTILDAGIRAQSELGGLRLLSVRYDTAWAKAGLWANDLIIAVNGLKPQDTWERTFAHYPVGSSILIHYFRRDELYTAELILESNPSETVAIQVENSATAAVYLGLAMNKNGEKK